MKPAVYYIISLVLLCSCTPKPKPIAYGDDHCTFCKMTIVDKRHAAQLVSDKGKIYNFDAIECMIPFMEKNDHSFSFILVNDLQDPGSLVDAADCTFIISEEIPSPMGAYLSATSDKIKADHIIEEQGGRLFSWEEIQTVIGEQYSNL